MILGRVAGEIYSTINHPILDARKLLLVDRIAPDGRARGETVIAIDRVDAGVGETVLLIDEGNSARQIIAQPNAPVRTIVVGIIDAIESAAGATVDDPRT
ncbi:MAG: hypothetical protein GF330_02325 [Candidatus Eisenbacteria bacterium]|nr:hypothetical protein [Candidatus Eisenbacteria bacterium]